MKVVVFPHLAGVAVLYPVTDAMSIEEIAQRDVPAGTPYRIVDRSELPEEQGTFQMAWEVDFSSPSGIAVGREAWDRAREMGGM